MLFIVRHNLSPCPSTHHCVSCGIVPFCALTFTVCHHACVSLTPTQGMYSPNGVPVTPTQGMYSPNGVPVTPTQGMYSKWGASDTNTCPVHVVRSKTCLTLPSTPCHSLAHTHAHATLMPDAVTHTTSHLSKQFHLHTHHTTPNHTTPHHLSSHLVHFICTIVCHHATLCL